MRSYSHWLYTFVLSLVVTLGVLVVPQAVSAKPSQSSQSASDYWSELIDEIDNDYDDISVNVLDSVRLDFGLRNDLLNIFRGQTDGWQVLRDIVLEVLLDGKDETNYRYRRYNLNRSCLPPGQRQRLASGKPVPAGILKKCGNVRYRND